MKCWMLCIFLLAPLSVHAESLKLAFVFQDAMVLQRDVPLPVWGTADPDSEITVTFAGQHSSTRSDRNGNWMVKLNPATASAQPRDLVVASTSTITLHDVLVGEVWLAAGQSNMEFPLSREAHAVDEVQHADLPDIRLMNLAYAGQYLYGKRFDATLSSRLTPDRFFSGSWAHCSPKSARPFSAIGYYFAKDLQKQIGVPVGVINMAVGGSPTEAWIHRNAMAAEASLRSLVEHNWLTTEPLDDWCKQRARQNLGPSPDSTDPTGPNHGYKPGFLWEAGVARLIPFAIRGVLWYQGESNSLTEPRMLQHEALFKTLVTDWRKSWNIGDFPFLYCQLSGIGTASYKSQFWPQFRDQQRRLLSVIPNTAMAVTSDFGNNSDVHFRDKREVAHRLYASAMSLAYGAKGEWEGPLVDSIHRNGSALLVSFTHASGLTTTDGGTIKGFEIAGSDGHFSPADVTFSDSVARLTSSRISSPTSARYDWQPFPDGNVINSAHFPCSTFSIDQGSNVR
jgi:sialate O-acetylesterase